MHDADHPWQEYIKTRYGLHRSRLYAHMWRAFSNLFIESQKQMTRRPLGSEAA